tara:strand:- start:259 stop:660 length:402 start_codon:yes stop_codon:yes gene_type:complete
VNIMADDDLLGSLEDLSGDSGDMTSQDSGGDMELEAQQEKDLERATDSKNLDMILDIPLVVTVELGRTKMMINDLLQLGQGSVIELSKLVGEPLEILVNDKLVARGEVVVVNEKFGVRLTDIVSPMERIESLG